MFSIASIPICQNVSTSTLHTTGDLIPTTEEALLIHDSALSVGKALALTSVGDLILNASRGRSAGHTANAFASVAVCGQKPPQTHDNNCRNICPEPRVKWVFPETLPASPLFTRVSGQVAAGRSAAAISAITARTPYGNSADSISGMDSATASGNSSKTLSGITAGATAGTSSAIASGNTASDTASPLPEVDFMTAEGVVRGDSRQQVSIKGSAPGMSHVLGHLAEHGIRAGANEALTPTRSYRGEEALAALFASGQMRGGVNADAAGNFLSAQIQKLLADILTYW